jgi:hypothetical protein
MQLYLVAYQVNSQTRVDIGRAVVLASNEAEANQLVAANLDIPIARTRFNTEVIAVGFMNLSRRSVAPSDDNLPANNFSAPEREWRSAIIPYNCKILAIASGEDEFHALKRVAHAVINKCHDQSGPQDRHVTRLLMDAEPRMPGHDKLKPLQSVEMYKSKVR